MEQNIKYHGLAKTIGNLGLTPRRDVSPLPGRDCDLGLNAPQAQSQTVINIAQTRTDGASDLAFNPALIAQGYEGATHGGSAASF